ncbi:MAG: outer membrane lipoprotein carrier protein LolA [Candidatus Omnitrophica bacterium]|nr:outer membrane lipoprotein carrier protein LolA [Candidatus Omnitrophota bacterium]
MKKDRIIFLIVFLFLAAFRVASGYCQKTDVDLIKNLKLIESKMSNINTLTTKFVQIKDLSLFKQKLEIKGSLYLKKPSSFAWHIDVPLKQRIILEKNIVKQWDEDTNQVQKINLDKNPSFSIMTDQMKRWVSGSYLSLVDEYEIEIVQSSPIRLKFTPLENSMAFKMIKSIVILFQEDETYIESIVISETNGDSTKFQFLETSLNVALDPQAWKIKPSD